MKSTNNKRGTQKQNTRELRLSAKSQKFEIRKNSDGSRITVEGYAVVWGAISEDLGFRERIQRGAFQQSLKDNPDVLMYWGHDSNAIVARVSNNSLSVNEDSKGLHFRATIFPQTTTAKDLIAMLEQELVTAMSFGFAVPDGGDEWSALPNGEILRTVNTAILFEISAVGVPAYSQTVISLRSCPSSLRAKIKRHDFDDDDIDDDMDDDDFDDDDDDTDETSECRCQCRACREDNCEECSDPDCDDDECIGCPYQERARQIDLVLRRLRS